jgi:hypothetical protein
MIRNNKGTTMKTNQTDILMKNTVFMWIALATGAILLIPFVLQLTIGTGIDGQGFNWTFADFVGIGTLIFVTSSLFVVTARRVKKKYQLAIGIAFLFAFLWLWAELSVGVFTTWGS